MSKSRHIRVRAVHKIEPDVRKLSRALITLAMAKQAKDEQEAQEQDNPDSGKAEKGSPRRPA